MRTVVPPTRPTPYRSAAAPPAPPAVLRVVDLEDRRLERIGHAAGSEYVETFWLPLLGPSATLLLRRLARGLVGSPGGYDLDLEEAARALGLGGVGGRRSPFRRAILRCARYGMARHPALGLLAVRRYVAPLSPHQLDRLPPGLREEHRRWEGVAGGPATDATHARWRAHLLAANQLTGEEARAWLEHRLLRLGLHPALAYESAGWATTRRQEHRQEQEDRQQRLKPSPPPGLRQP